MSGRQASTARDSNGITQQKHGRDLRAKFPLPEGGVVKCKYKNGLDRDTWSSSTCRAGAYYNGKRLGTYSTYRRARNAIIKASEDKPIPKPKKRKRKATKAKKPKANGTSTARVQRHRAAKGVTRVIELSDRVARVRIDRAKNTIDLSHDTATLQKVLLEKATQFLDKAAALERAAIALREGE